MKYTGKKNSFRMLKALELPADITLDTANNNCFITVFLGGEAGVIKEKVNFHFHYENSTRCYCHIPPEHKR